MHQQFDISNPQTLYINTVTTLQTMQNSLTFPRRFAALLRCTRHVKCSHIMPVLVLNTCMDANMQFTINSFRPIFSDKIFSLTFP